MGPRASHNGASARSSGGISPRIKGTHTRKMPFSAKPYNPVIQVMRSENAVPSRRNSCEIWS